MRIEVNQLPPIECSPNWRGHWAQRHQAARIYQEAVFYSCVDVRNQLMAIGEWQPFNRVRIDLTFVYPEYRRRDRDNIVSRAKSGIDAIVDAALLLDDDAEHLEIWKVDILVDPGRAPLTIIGLEELG